MNLELRLDPTLQKMWYLANVVGLALCLGWLGTHQPTGLQDVAFWPLLLTGALWGLLQWRVVRAAVNARRLLPLWGVGTLAGWLLSQPFIAVGIFPQSVTELPGLATEYWEYSSPPEAMGVIGFFVAPGILTFTSILCGLTLGLGHWVLLLLSYGWRAAQGWWGNVAWSWILGQFLSGLLVMFLMVGVTAVFQIGDAQIQLPNWFIWSLLGAFTGLFYSLYTEPQIALLAEPQ